MQRIVLACNGVPAHVAAAAARDITEESTHRPWHENVRCEWDGSQLVLQADNDFDSKGLARFRTTGSQKMTFSEN